MPEEGTAKKVVPRTLFVAEDNMPMAFSIKPVKHKEGAVSLQNLQNIIERGGGRLNFQHSVIGEYTIPLIGKGDVILDAKDDFFKVQFIYDCVEERKIVDLNLYRSNNTRFQGDVDPYLIMNRVKSWKDLERKNKEDGTYVSDFSGDEVETTEKQIWSSKVKKSYTFEEEKAIFNYIFSRKLQRKVGGNVIWQHMVKVKICPGRSWQSLKQRYRKNIRTDLTKFKLAANTTNKLPLREEKETEAKEAAANSEKTQEPFLRFQKAAVSTIGEQTLISGGNETTALSHPNFSLFCSSEKTVSKDIEKAHHPEVTAASEKCVQSPIVSSPENTPEFETHETAFDSCRKDAVQSSTTGNESLISPTFSGRPTTSDFSKLPQSTQIPATCTSDSEMVTSTATLPDFLIVDDGFNKEPTEVLPEPDVQEIAEPSFEDAEVSKNSSAKNDSLSGSETDVSNLSEIEKQTMNHHKGEVERKRQIIESSSESADEPSIKSDHISKSRKRQIIESSSDLADEPSIKSDHISKSRKRYLLLKSSSESDDSTSDSIQTFERKVRNASNRKHISYKYRKLFTFEEDMKILKFIEKNSAYCLVNGNMLWQKMEKRGIVQGRSWQSLKERYRKRIQPNFILYKGNGLSEESEIKLKKRLSSRAKITQTQENPSISVTNKAYKKEEDILILHFISENRRYAEVGGVRLWKLMENRLEDRTWQSLKNRFLKYIIPHLHKYGLTPEENRNFRLLRSRRNDQYTSDSEQDDSSQSEESTSRRRQTYRTLTMVDPSVRHTSKVGSANPTSQPTVSGVSDKVDPTAVEAEREIDESQNGNRPDGDESSNTQEASVVESLCHRTSSKRVLKRSLRKRKLRKLHI